MDGASPVLERSVNMQDWVRLPVSDTAKNYVDADVFPGSKYYYRLSFSKDGQNSDYASAEIIMPDVLGTSTAAPALAAPTKTGSGGISSIVKYAAITLAVLGALAALAFVPFKPAKLGRKRNYHEYLHSKYFNL
jgi:hypothetical protein